MNFMQARQQLLRLRLVLHEDLTALHAGVSGNDIWEFGNGNGNG